MCNMCIINHRFGIVSGSGNFKALSNFKIEIEVEVAAPTGNGILGYICAVTLYDGKDLGYVLASLL